MKKNILSIIFLLITGLSIDSQAQYTKLLDFAGTSNGKWPQGSLISDGPFFYGMTTNGGTNDFGTIFKILPDGTEYSKLLDFAGATNGRNPVSSLFFDGTFLYGSRGVVVQTIGVHFSKLCLMIPGFQNY